MVGPVNENFEIQDPVRIRDAPAQREEARSRTSATGVITSRKGLVIFGVSLIGVLAIAGVAIGVSTSQSSSSAPVEGSKTANVHSAYSSGLAKFRDVKTKVETPERAKEEEKSLDEKILNDTVCATPECLASAATLIASIDETADPCVDFYQFACGRWYESHPVTNESLGTFYAADDLVQESLQTILESEAAPDDPVPVQEIRIHYANCLDTDTMDTVGIAPLWTQLTVQGGWPLVMDTWTEDAFDFEAALVHVQKLGVNPFVGVGIDADFRNTSRKILYFSEGGLAISSSILLDPDNHVDEIASYKQYISTSAMLVRDSIGSAVEDASISQEVDDLVSFETDLASAMQFIPFNKTDIIAYTDIAGIQAITDLDTPGQIDWLAFFQIMFGETDVLITSEEPIYVYAEKYLRYLSTLFSTTPSRTIANYLGWWWTRTTGSATTYAMRTAEDTYNQDMYGSSPMTDRTQHCIDQTNYNLGFPTSRAYIDGYFPTEAKPEVSVLVELIRSAFQSLLDENTWMAPDDLVVAKEKLTAIVDHVAYPDWILDNAMLTLTYQGLSILPGEQFDNLMRIADYYDYWNLETFRDEVSKVFLMPPTVVNAFYDVFANQITILAGILQPPFYSHNSLAALNYGGIGMVIGHEFTHGFDNNGRHFDKDGNYANWWSQETIDAFNERASCFVDQYDNYYPPEFEGTGMNQSVNGQQTLGENIADNGGIREAFRAYTSYVEQFGAEPMLPGLEQFTSNQLFFLGFANVWCEHKTTDALVSQLNSDPHAPGRFRVIGPLSNDADFWETYNCPAGSPMNRGDDSCILW